MSKSLEAFLPWLDCGNCDRSPDYYSLLKLVAFESDLDIIEQALFQATLDVSNFLHSPQRELAESVLEQINRAESCLTDSTTKAAYDASLRASLAHLPSSPAGSGTEEQTRGQELKPVAVETIVDDLLSETALIPKPNIADDCGDARPINRSIDSHAARSRVPTGKPPGNDAASSADRSVWEAIQNSRRHSTVDTRKKATSAHNEHPNHPRAVSPVTSATPPAANSPAPTVSLSNAIVQSLVAQIPKPLIKYRGRIFVGAFILAGLGFAVKWTSAALDKPLPKRPPVIFLDPDEKLLVGEQMSVLYDPQNDAAKRTAAVEKLRTLSATTIRHYSDRFTRLADKQAEPEIQEALRALVHSSKESPQT